MNEAAVSGRFLHFYWQYRELKINFLGSFFYPIKRILQDRKILVEIRHKM